MSKVAKFLKVKKDEFASNADLSERFVSIEEMYNKRLYHQLTLELLQIVQLKELQKGDQLIQLHDNLITAIETRINPLSYVELLTFVVRQISDASAAIEFLKASQKKVPGSEDAVNLCKVITAQIYLEKLKDLKSTKEIIDEIEESLDDAGGVTVAHGRFYLLASQYYKLTNNHAQYYRTALKYLGCIELNSLSIDEQYKHAFFLCLGALLGDDVYNLGELLAHPIMESLRSTEHHWLLELVTAFNRGDMATFNAMKPKWSSIGDLLVHESKLRQKICLLCIIEMAFQRPAHNKQLTFDQISSQTDLSHKDVEHLVMKALSLGLLRGAIDEIAKTVNVTWVQPRVLDKGQVTSMAQRLDQWCLCVQRMESILENRTTDFISSDFLIENKLQ